MIGRCELGRTGSNSRTSSSLNSSAMPKTLTRTPGSAANPRAWAATIGKIPPPLRERVGVRMPTFMGTLRSLDLADAHARHRTEEDSVQYRQAP